MDRALALKRDDDDDALRTLLRSHQGLVTMDSLRLALDGIAAEEKMRYERRIRSYDENQSQVRGGFLILVGLNLVLVTLGAVFLSQDSRRRRRETTEARDRAARVEERTAELLGLTHHLQKVREEEKAAVAREIHDELGGTLVAAKIDLQLLSDPLESDDPQRARFDRVMAAIDNTIQIKRRIIENLRPSLLDSLGIGPAHKWQCAEFSKRLRLPCQVELADENLRLSPDHSIALYRIVQEALTNVSKYAHAKKVAVSLQRDGEHWVLRIADDGIGIDTAKQHQATAHGLLSMRERARALGGKFSVQGQSGRGTIVEVRVPIEDEAGSQRPASADSRVSSRASP
jgi:signal transduction histidine kinase